MDTKLDYANSLSDELKSNVEELKKDTDKIKNDLSKAQTDYIAILGIFASVVLAFVGGIAFSTSVFENISEVNIYRLLIVSLIIGVVFVTVIFLMFYFVGVLTGRQITGKGQNCPLIIAYGFFIILIIAVCGMWHHGIVEGRDNRVSKQYESNVTEIIETTEATETTNTLESSQVDIMTETADTE